MPRRKKPSKTYQPLKKKILFIDDEPYVRSIMKRRLEFRKYEVETAPDGIEGLTLAKQWNPQMIILDHLMPYINGVEVCKKLKADRLTARIPVIIFTAHVATGFETACIEAGAVGIIYKPTVSELLALMQKVFKGEKIHWGEE